ncbi:MAG: hypothetical protein LBJ86_00590 [Spirochaetaceae bacterium]|nr:hypothetical protein [Spirochaetaceae bacterium]
MPEHTMYAYWKTQPDILEDIFTKRKELTARFVHLFLDTKPEHLYLVGSGTSFNAISAAAPFIEETLGIAVRTVMPSRLPAVFGRRPLIVYLSQGGSSTNTLAAMDALAAYPSIVITGEEDSEIARRGANHMLIGCGPEFAGPKTAGYTSSVLILYLCALESALASGAMPQPRHDGITATLACLAADARVNIARTEMWFTRNQQELLAVQKYILTGRGFAGAVAVEGALKLLETIKVPAIGFEFEEYLHGPILMTDAALGGVFFISEDPEVKPRMVELARCHQRYSRFTYTVTRDDAIQGDRVLHLQMSGNPFTEVFEFVLMPQLLAARVPGLLGIADGSEVYDAYTGACATKYNNGR